ncbi:hypothetical protein AB0G15_41700 [Streptosporangium sp. NPDC023825]|uniref:hypothetical protein n=1 Tax=Streptosporangium sp. NPDC023825 TaxID=3154909 RepID=UPI00344813E2
MERIACAARAMAAGFRLGGKLIVFGGTGTDAAHIAVEFMHPVIVGKRALPAVALSNGAPAAGRADDEAGRRNGDGAGNDEGSQRSGNSRNGGDRGSGAEVFAHQVRHWADAADTALGISRDGRCPSVLRGLETAGELGLLTIALTGGGGRGDGDGIADGAAIDDLPADRAMTGHTMTDHTLTGRSPTGHTMTGHTMTDHTMTGHLPADHVLVAASDDPAVVKEVHVTAYHLLWELVHVFLDRLGPPERGADR